MREQTYGQQLGAALRARRRLLRLNQTEVAELAGTTQRTVSQVETGKASGLELYAAVAEVLGLALTVLPRDEAEDRGSTGGTTRGDTAAVDGR